MYALKPGFLSTQAALSEPLDRFVMLCGAVSHLGTWAAPTLVSSFSCRTLCISHLVLWILNTAAQDNSKAQESDAELGREDEQAEAAEGDHTQDSGANGITESSDGARDTEADGPADTDEAGTGCDKGDCSCACHDSDSCGDSHCGCAQKHWHMIYVQYVKVCVWARPSLGKRRRPGLVSFTVEASLFGAGSRISHPIPFLAVSVASLTGIAILFRQPLFLTNTYPERPRRAVPLAHHHLRRAPHVLDPRVQGGQQRGAADLHHSAGVYPPCKVEGRCPSCVADFCVGDCRL